MKPTDFEGLFRRLLEERVDFILVGGVAATVHPGIGYDIISCHPMFNGALLGRAAELDFKLFAGSVDQLDGGTVISVGSAIMAPQVFEKSLSCVHNLRFQDGRPPVRRHEHRWRV